MHLRNFPHYYVKDGERRAVYYSADARNLRAEGWVEEGKQAQTKPEPTPEASPEPLPAAEVDTTTQPEPSTDEQEKPPAFELMTKVELLQYALNRGVDLPNNALKSEIIEACKKL